MNMVVLPGDQINKMAEIMECILSPRGMSVADIKRKFKLTNEEYDMIFDLSMPRIRHNNGNEFWKNNYLALRNQIYERLRKEEYGDKLATDISRILQNNQVGRRRKKEEHLEDLLDESEIT